MSAPTPPRLRVEQHLRRAQATSYSQELDLSHASDLTPSVLEALAEMMPNVQKLNVMGTGLRALPKAVCRLPLLRELNASNNALSALPDELCGLQLLQHLNLAKNALESLPEGFGNLASLRLLNANNNRLRRLPDGFGQLPQLRVLRLGANALSSLPPSVAKLNLLRLLQLGHNAFRTFPANLGRLSRLSVLDLSYNRLTALPEWLRNMAALATLNVTGNPLTQVPPPLSLPQELRITGVYSLLESPVAQMLEEQTQPDSSPLAMPEPGATVASERPAFHGPQGQLDVTGIFLAGLLPGDNDAPETSEPSGQNPREPDDKR